MSDLLRQYECGPVQFSGDVNAFYERHLVFDTIHDAAAAGPRERFEAFARSVRDVLSQRWLRADIDRGVRGQRHEQHEVHDERRADDRHA
jgi:glycogen phosphorylase